MNGRYPDPSPEVVEALSDALNRRSPPSELLFEILVELKELNRNIRSLLLLARADGPT